MTSIKNQTSPTQPLRRASLFIALAAALTTGACASVPRPIPAGDQPIASATVGNVVVNVPRLDHGDYPGDILEVSTAVLVVIENRGSTELNIDPQSFTLGSPEGMRYQAVPPQQLAERKLPDKDKDSLNMSGVALAWRGGGGGGGVRVAPPSGFSGGMRSAPMYRGGGGFGGGVRVAPPSFGGGSRYYGGGPRYYGGGYRSFGRPGFGYGYRPGYYATRPWWAWNYPGLWGPGWGYGWYGSTWWWDGSRYYANSRADAIQMALPAGKLPPGGRTGGFLYFPRVELPEGSTVVLQWQPRDVNGQVLGELSLPLELSSSSE
jgi:hypothetical protein